MPDYKIISPKRKRKQQYVAFGLVYAIIAFYFLINGGKIFDYWDTNLTYTTLFYMAGVSLFLSISEKIPDELRKPAIQSIYGFLLATPIFMLGFIVFEMAGILVVEHKMPVYLLLMTMGFQFTIVAASEEIIFRAAIFRALYRIRWYIGYIGSSILFGVFHWAAYGGNVNAVIFAMLMGVVFCFLADKFNLGVAIAAHGVWNVGLMGALLFN